MPCPVKSGHRFNRNGNCVHCGEPEKLPVHTSVDTEYHKGCGGQVIRQGNQTRCTKCGPLHVGH